MTSVFVLSQGQEDNIGDVVLRRQLLSMVREHGELHVFVGDPSAAFLAGLELDRRDVVYRSRKEWRRAAARSARHGRTWLVDKPGEIVLNRRYLLSELRLLPLELAVKVRSGAVLRLGMGQRQADRWLTPVFRTLFRYSDLVAWRDSSSYDSFRIGQVMPDLGFGETGRTELGRPRRRLVLSYRSDRPELSDTALEGIARAARESDLTVTVVTQVRRDRPRSQSLARRLSAELVDWPEDRDHAAQEQALREVYAETALAVSDRLHVLIVAMTEGAVPLCLVEHAESKVARHFEVIGYPRAALGVSASDSSAVAAHIREALARREEVAAALLAATGGLEVVRARVGALVTSSPGR